MEDNKTIHCDRCKKDVVPVVKMFGTLLCPDCNIILASPTRDRVDG